MDNRNIIIYDGICTLCNRSVRFVQRHQRPQAFTFLSNKSTEAKELLQHHQISMQQSELGIIYIEENRYYEQSTAVLKICRRLKPLWMLLSLFIVVPKPFRDAIYRTIAKHRYRWFGQEQCEIHMQDVNQEQSSNIEESL